MIAYNKIKWKNIDYKNQKWKSFYDIILQKILTNNQTEFNIVEQFDTFDVHVTVHRDKFLIIKPTRCTNFSHLFWNETLHVTDSSSVHHQEFFTVHTAMVYVIQVSWQPVSRSIYAPAHKLSANLYDINHCCAHSEKLLILDRGTVRNM